MASSDAMLGRFGTTDEDVKPEINLKNEITHVVMSFCLFVHDRALVTSVRSTDFVDIIMVAENNDGEKNGGRRPRISALQTPKTRV